MIPLQYYTEFYYNVLLVIVFFVLLHTTTKSGNEYISHVIGKALLFIILSGVTLYMGLRPISYVFGDMGTYARVFEYLSRGGFLPEKDIGFSLFISGAARIMSAKTFFFICVVLYVFPVYIALKRWHKHHVFLAILIFIASFSFWSYGTNGIRAGIASSLFICGLSYRNSPLVMLTLFLLSVSFHQSMLLPLLAFSVTYFYNNYKGFFLGWIIAIILSFSMGGFWENLFASIGFADERFGHYLTSTEFSHQFSSTGFRWDFLAYSSLPVMAGFLFIYRYNFNDKFYRQLYNTYVLSNAFWILIIRSAFSNRFAYLSWFLMAIVIIYPLLRKRMFKYQYSMIGLIIFFYYSFTYAMFYIVGARG